MGGVGEVVRVWGAVVGVCGGSIKILKNLKKLKVIV